MARALTAWQKHVKAEAKRTGKTGKALFKAASKTYTKKPKQGAAPRARKRSNPKVKNVSSRKPKLFRTISGIGALEDLGVGLAGGILFRTMGFGANAVPATRIVQGIAGVGMDRRGKRHLVQGTIDFVDNWLLDVLGHGVGSSLSGPPSINGLIAPLKTLKIMR